MALHLKLRGKKEDQNGYALQELQVMEEALSKPGHSNVIITLNKNNLKGIHIHVHVGTHSQFLYACGVGVGGGIIDHREVGGREGVREEA